MEIEDLRQALLRFASSLSYADSKDLNAAGETLYDALRDEHWPGEFAALRGEAVSPNIGTAA